MTDTKETYRIEPDDSRACHLCMIGGHDESEAGRQYVVVHHVHVVVHRDDGRLLGYADRYEASLCRDCAMHGWSGALAQWVKRVEEMMR